MMAKMQYLPNHAILSAHAAAAAAEVHFALSQRTMPQLRLRTRPRVNGGADISGGVTDVAWNAWSEEL